MALFIGYAVQCFPKGLLHGMIGETLKQRYRVEARLGRGAMGEVYRAIDLRFGEPVAIKMLVSDDASDQYRKRFMREISALRKLYHPNIVGYVDAFAAEDRLFLVMEYVGGGTLADLIESYGQLPVDLFRQLARKTAEAVDSAHALGVVHRDLKPSNILLAADGEPKVADFGLAKLTNFSTITLSGGAMGTLAYMPPEAFEVPAAQDYRGDIWALGVIFFQMLAGSLPFPGQGKAELVKAILHDPPVSLRWLRKDLPPTWYDMVVRCLEKPVDKRYQSVFELLEDLKKGIPAASDRSRPGGVLTTVYDLGPDPLLKPMPRQLQESTPRLESQPSHPTVPPQRTEMSVTPRRGTWKQEPLEVEPGSYWSRWAQTHFEKLARRRRAVLPPAMQMIASFLVWAGIVLTVGNSLLIVLEYMPATRSLNLPFDSLRALQTMGGLLFIAGEFFGLFHVPPRHRVELLFLILLTGAVWLFFFSGQFQFQIIGDLEMSMVGMILYAVLIVLYFRVQSD